MTNVKTAAVVIIGNEILSGRTHDKNGNYIAAKMTEIGVQVREMRVVPDLEAEIMPTLKTLKDKYDYVFTTGGIGPTHDDITAECVAKTFDREYEINKDAYDILLEYYGEADFNEARQKMTYMPSGDDVSLILNPVSAAPGFHIGNVFVMAGVPKIMNAMLDNVIPILESGCVMHSVTISSNLSEGVLAKPLSKLQGEFQNIDIGCYPRFKKDDFGVSIVFRSIDKAVIEKAADQFEEILKELNGNVISRKSS